MVAGNLPRRGALKLLAGAAVALGASGCGFQLRRAPELAFHTIQLKGFKPLSTLADELKRSLSFSTTTRVVEAAAQADVILEALADVRDKSVSTPGTAGQVLELQLHTRFNFRLITPSGKELLPETTIAEVRDLSFNERDALGKELEEESLYRAMQSDIAAQVLRRLAAVKQI